MKICLLTTQVPFIRGGAEYLTDTLASQLELRGHNVELVQLPFTNQPAKTLDNCIDYALSYDLNSRCDLAIGLKFPSYYIQHRNKSLWIMHQLREFYDLWGNNAIAGYSEVRGIPTVREKTIELDSRVLGKHKTIYTISPNVTERLKKFNGVDSIPMYPPPPNEEMFVTGSFGNYLLAPSRLGPLKRQDLIIEALAHSTDDLKVIFLGAPDSDDYLDVLRKKAETLGVASRIHWAGRVSESEKFKLFSECRGVIFTPIDEDLGYITMEAALSNKPVITCLDSGGPLEFVKSGVNGWISEANPQGVSEAMNALWSTPAAKLRQMGEEGLSLYKSKNISWDAIIGRLL